MDDNNVLALLANMCIYYYISYHEKILFKKVNIPDNTLPGLMKRIKQEYIMSKHTSEIYDISIMIYPYDKQYILNDDYLDAVEMMECIDRYIEEHRYIYYSTLPQINVVSVSDHPIENYYCFTHEWIKQAIDIYRY